MLLSGCTLAAQATPAEPSSVSSSHSGPTATVPQLSPVDAAQAVLRNLYGPEGVSSVVAQVANTETGLVVTLVSPPSTLGGAEAYWRVCTALLGTLQAAGSGAVQSLLIAQPDGAVVVRADAGEAAACKLG